MSDEAFYHVWIQVDLLPLDGSFQWSLVLAQPFVEPAILSYETSPITPTAHLHPLCLVRPFAPPRSISTIARFRVSIVSREQLDAFRDILLSVPMANESFDWVLSALDALRRAEYPDIPPVDEELRRNAWNHASRGLIFRQHAVCTPKQDDIYEMDLRIPPPIRKRRTIPLPGV